MSLANITMNQIIIMFFMILVGIACFKLNYIEGETNKKLSNLLLMLIGPCLIFISYQREFSKELLRGLVISIILAILTHMIGIAVAYIIFREKDNKDIIIERFSAIYSNCSFMGIPLINGVYGSEGVFYLTAYITVFNLFIWTHGLMLMIGKQKPKEMIKMLISPTLIATTCGFIFFLGQIKIPTMLYQTMEYIASINTPLAMMVAGVTIAQTDIRKVLFKGRIYLVAFVKLLVVALVALMVYRNFPISDSVLTTSIIAAACPAAATGTLFSLRYNKNALYASEIFAVTTLLSVITIPLIAMLITWVI